MSRIDSFFDDQVTSIDGYYMTDAWVELGGEYIYFEWAVDSIIGLTDIYWYVTQEFFDFTATNGDFVATPIQIKHDVRTSPEDVSVVTVVMKSPRIIAVDETVQIVSSPGGFGGLANNLDMINVPSSANKTIRNYSMVGTTGAASVPPRSGSSPYYVQTDPETDANFNFSIADGTVKTSEGLLEGTNVTLRTRRGALDMTPSDPLFNGEKSFNGSASWIGEIVDHTGFEDDFTLIFAVNLPANSKFCYSVVEETGGSNDGPVMGPGGTGVGRPTSVSFAIQPFPTQTPSSVSFEVTDLWTMEEANERHRLLWSSPNNVGLGKMTDRTLVGALKYDASAEKFTIYSFGGNPVDEVLHTIAEPTLGANEYFAFRTENSARFAEIMHISSAISDIEMREYLSFLDEKYATSSEAFYIDSKFGLDTQAGTEASPYKTISKAVSQCLVGAGDQIFINAGSVAQTQDTIDLFPDDIQNAPLGYSPDHPFTLGIYGDRSANGRAEFKFVDTSEKFFNTEQHNENLLIFGLKLYCPERDITDGTFIGQDAMKDLSDGYGIFKRSSGHVFQTMSESLRVYDCTIENTLRHAVTISSSFSNPVNANKYSAVVKTGIKNLYNANYMAQNQIHSVGSSNYGVAGIFSEKQNGIHIQDCMFYRVGWSPDLVIDSGITYASGYEYREDENAIVGNGLVVNLTAYDSWEYSTYADHNSQRLLVTGISGSSASEILSISAGISVVGATLGIYLKESPSILSQGSTCGIQVLDPFPRCSGNADIVIGDKSFGHTTICESIFVESSGHNIISNDGFIEYMCVNENNQFGTVISSTYTHIVDSYFGGTVGTAPIRKAPNNLGMTIGEVFIENTKSQHGWMAKTIPNNRMLYAIFTGSIYARENGYGFENSNNDAPLNSAFHFDKNLPNQNFNFLMRKNTFWSIPGMIISFSTENPNSIAFSRIERNIFDQELDYTSGSYGSSAESFIYGFRDPFTGNYTNAWGPMSFGGLDNINLYNQRDLSTAPTDGFLNYLIDTSLFADIGFDLWRATEASEKGEWIDIQYTDAPRSLATYNSDQLAGNTSATEFMDSAFTDMDLGWSSGYSTEEILSYIKIGWQPTNIDQASYGDDYIGAVEFNYTPTTTGFKSYYGGEGDFFGFGKGN